jgi:YidC/Oxa1 family membrane protein insertase
MDKPRPILAVILSLAVLFIFYRFLVPERPQPEPVAPSEGTQQQEPVESKKLDPDGNEEQIKGKTLPHLSSLPVSYFKSDEAGQRIVLQNKAVSARINPYGGGIDSWVLSDYREGVEESSPAINLMGGKEEGNAINLTLGYPEFDNNPQFVRANANLPGSSDVSLTWSSSRLKVQKQILFSEDNPYLMDIHVSLKNEGSEAIRLSPMLWVMRKQRETEANGGIFSFLRGPSDVFYPLFFQKDKLESFENWEKLSVAETKQGNIFWGGIADRYFLVSVITGHEAARASVRYGKEKGNVLYAALTYGDVVVNAGETIEESYQAYIGPKKREELGKLGVHLEASIDYGWFSFVSIPMLWLLVFFEKYLGNWGLSIIVLTFLVKLLLHPVNKKSMMSMKAMQKLGPKLKEIKEKYKNDKQRLNTEMMQLFKTHKVNPMGGCLPMLIQMPVYIALYKVLWSSIELYHAPFFWFYKDLSAPDPYMITPVLLGIFMYFQQKLTPQAATMDPAQAKIMMMMPVMFGVFMIFFPFGLVLYILVSTVTSVIQQYMIHNDLTFLGLLKKLRRQTPNDA